MAISQKRWRARVGKRYWTVSPFGNVEDYQELECSIFDDCLYAVGNYWRTQAQARAYADACKDLAMELHEQEDGYRGR